MQKLSEVGNNMNKKTDSKKIEMMGIRLDNYTVRESLLRLDTYLGNTILNIIETVTMKQLILSVEMPVIKNCLNQADLCVIGECEILSETENDAIQRMREVRNWDFLHELLKRMSYGRKRVFLLAMTDEELHQIQKMFLEKVPQFEAAGSYAVESCVGDMDTIVNEINGETPDIVISALDSPMEEEFILSHKDKIGTSVWYGIGVSYYKNQGKIQVGNTLKKLALRGRLRHSVSKYRQNENKDRI
jgi:N-acetylglucosaminyldiphosphoundecaprenol N-acetyl-beta-D-mannosaminyltransferase